MLTYKVILVGESNVGKTSLLNAIRYKNNGLTSVRGGLRPTTNLDILMTKFKFVKNGSEVTIALELWDTVGTETHAAMTQTFFRNANAIVFCFDLTNEESFNKLLTRWGPACIRSPPETGSEEVASNVNIINDKCIYSAIGTKFDLCYEKLSKVDTKSSFTYITNNPTSGKQITGRIVSMVPTSTQNIVEDGMDETGPKKIKSIKTEYSMNIHNISEDFRFFFTNKHKRTNSNDVSPASSRKSKIVVTSATDKIEKHPRKDSVGQMMNSRNSLNLSERTIQQRNTNTIYELLDKHILKEETDIKQIFLTSALDETDSYGVDKFFIDLALTLWKHNSDSIESLPPSKNETLETHALIKPSVERTTKPCCNS